MILEAVIFDMDGVLCATVKYQLLSWQRMAQDYNIPFGDKQIEKIRGLTRRRTVEVLVENLDMITEKQIQEMMERKNTYYLEFVSKMGSDNALPGVVRLLSELQQTDLKIAVASGSILAKTILDKLDLIDYFDVIVDGATILESKPAPTIFLHAASLLNVKPEACIVIEDAAAGVQAGLTAGMCVIGLGPSDRVGKAHAVFEDLSNIYVDNLISCYNSWQSVL